MEQELRELYEENFSKIYNYVFYKLLHKEKTEDLVSDIFLKAVANFDRYDSEKASAKTWIFTIARNTLINHYRAQKAVVSLDDDAVSWEPSVNFEEQYDLIRDENRRELFRALTELSMREREILQLKYDAEMTVREIAALMQLNESSVSTIHLRALKKLRTLLDEKIGFYVG